MSSNETNGDSTVELRAEGNLYAVEIQSDQDDLDLVDRLLLTVTRDPQRVEELRTILPLPARLIDNGLAKLIERNLLLLEVAGGRVRASGMPESSVPSVPKVRTILVWQDYATGALLPWDAVKPWSKKYFGPKTRPLSGGPPARTVFEMSGAELLHELRRYRLDAFRTDMVLRREAVRRAPLSIAAFRHESGRYMVMDKVPRDLRARWSRLPWWRAEGGQQQLAPDLPLPWGDQVERWCQGMEASIRTAVHALSRRDPDEPLLWTLDAALAVEVSQQGTALTRALARQARSSVVVAVSRDQGSIGDALGILRECRDPQVQRVLVAEGLVPKVKHRNIAATHSISILERHRGVPGLCGVDFVLVDGRQLCLGGVAHTSTQVVAVHSQTPLDGVLAWLSVAPVTVRCQPSADADDQLARRIKALVLDLADQDLRIPADQGTTLTDGDRQRRVERLAKVQQTLETRLRAIEADLLGRRIAAFNWLRADDVLVLVRHHAGTLRVVVRDPGSPLASEALGAQRECAQWRPGDAPAEVVIVGDLVLLGCWRSGEVHDAPDFLVVHGGETASKMTMATNELQRI